VVEGFLSALDPQEREDLRKLGSVRRYRRGDVLFHQGDDAGAVLVLITGHVKAAMMNDGREVILAFPGPGEILGELSAVDGKPRSGTVRAVDDIEALVIPGGAFRAFLEKRPRVALVLLRSVAERLREADRLRVDYAVNDVVVRVAGRLVELCDRYGAEDGAGIDVGLAITQDELAAWAGASREAVAKGMALLRTLGWVRTERRRIIVLDLPALRRYSGVASAPARPAPL
jgi:CRP/FNR family transcriptional regulator, cyclic AMP receptor protein